MGTSRMYHHMFWLLFVVGDTGGFIHCKGLRNVILIDSSKIISDVLALDCVLDYGYIIQGMFDYIIAADACRDANHY